MVQPRGNDKHPFVADDSPFLSGKRAQALPRQETPFVPCGLGTRINNYHEQHKMMTSLYYGLEDETEIEEKFQAMRRRVTGSGMVFRDKETGEVKDVKNRSRWNADFRYDMSVKSRLEDEVSGLKKVVLVTLTYDMNLVRQLIPGWWSLSEQAFVILFNNMFVSNFLNQVREYRKRRSWKNNYVGGVVEFHSGCGANKGILHNHLIFYGSGVADIKKLHQFWGLSQFQGVDIKRGQGKNIAGYIAKYIGKSLGQFQDDPELKRLAKWFWHFRRRLYNVRHKKEGQKGLGIPAQAYELIGVSFKGDIHYINEGKKQYREQMRGIRRGIYDHWVEYEDDE